MKRTKNRTKIATRTALAAVAALGMLMSFMGNGFADQARTSSASAYGLEAQGLLPIAKTPTASVTAPPDNSVSNNALLNVPAAALAVEALLAAKAEAHLADSAQPVLTAQRPNVTKFEPVTVTGVNSRGYASADNLRVLLQAVPGVDCNATPEATGCVAVVLADAIESEAVAKCVNNQPVFDTGYSRVRATALGIDVGQIVNPVLDPVLNLFKTGGALATVATIDEGVVDPINENGQQVGIAIDGLRISVLGTTEVIRVAHSEARMPRDCGVAAASPAASPAARLAQTGGGGLSSILGGSLLGAAVLMMIFVRKYRLSS